MYILKVNIRIIITKSYITYVFFSIIVKNLGKGPAGLEPPAGARKRRKASVKKNEETRLIGLM